MLDKFFNMVYRGFSILFQAGKIRPAELVGPIEES